LDHIFFIYLIIYIIYDYMSRVRCDVVVPGSVYWAVPRSVYTYNYKYADGAVAYGGYAERVRVSHHYAFRIPDALPSDQAAPLLCAGVTTFAPLKRLGVYVGTRVGVVGIGGLGHLSLQFAAALGRGDRHLEVVQQGRPGPAAGATKFLLFNDDAAIAAAANAFDVVVVTTDQNDNDWARMLSLIDAGGKLLLLAAPNKPLAVPALAGSGRSWAASSAAEPRWRPRWPSRPSTTCARGSTPCHSIR
jgi:D-arabinose 1-dehydrogenase-like Zn-dependent alcohol dehydrogenase